MIKYTEKSIKEYCKLLSSKEPIPGGGSVASLIGALSASLASMVANLTVGKDSCIEVNPLMEEIILKANNLKDEFLQLADEDSKAFEPLSRVYAMKSNTDEEKARKSEKMEEALNKAVAVPIKVIERATELVELNEKALLYGNKLALSDAGLGAILANTAMESAILNVYINTKYMRNKEVANNINSHCEDLLSEYGKKAHSVYLMAKEKLKGE